MSDRGTGGVHESHTAHIGGRGPHSRHDAHRLGDLDGLVADVHALATGPQPRCAFDNRRREAVGREPVRQRLSGDTRTRNENVPIPHRVLLSQNYRPLVSSDGSLLTIGQSTGSIRP